MRWVVLRKTSQSEPVFEFQKLVDGQPGRPDETAQGAFGNLFVIGNGQRCDMAVFDKDNVTSALTHNLPAVSLKVLNHLASAEMRKRRHQTMTST
jgi:hypothetical protein